MAGKRAKTTGAKKILVTAKVKQALELRIAGHSLATIAQRCGYQSEQAVHNAIKAALKRTIKEPAEAVRQLELTRLDALLVSIWDGAVQTASTEDVELYTTLVTLLEGVQPQSEKQVGQLDALREWLPLLMRRARTQHLDALDRALKIMGQRLLYITGLKVPDKVAPTTPDGTQPYVYQGHAFDEHFAGEVAAILREHGQLGASAVADESLHPADPNA